MAMFVDTDEGKSIADALVILNGYCLHRMSVEGTGRFKYVPLDDKYPPGFQDRPSPEEFVRSAASHLVERYREAMNISTQNMYLQYGVAKARGRKTAW